MLDLREQGRGAQGVKVPAFPKKEPDFTLTNRGSHLLLKGTLGCFKPEDLEFTVKSDSITIQGTAQEEQRVDREDFWQEVQSRSAFLRTISLPEKIDPQKVEVKVEGEALTVTMPKQGIPESRTIKIKPQDAGKFLQ